MNQNLLLITTGSLFLTGLHVPAVAQTFQDVLQPISTEPEAISPRFTAPSLNDISSETMVIVASEATRMDQIKFSGIDAGIDAGIDDLRDNNVLVSEESPSIPPSEMPEMQEVKTSDTDISPCCIGADSIEIETIPVAVDESSQAELVSTAAADLVIQPRFSVGHSSSGAGVDGLTYVEGFVPIQQNNGTRLTYISGRVSLDNRADLGGNITVGHRNYSPKSNRILGGYVGVDTRETDSNTFYQVGAGIESLGDWDVRLNGYLPVGDSQATIQDSTLATGVDVTSSHFQGNDLLVSGQRAFQHTLVRDVAMAGFDLETGTTLSRWENDGNLYAAGGIYYQTGGNQDVVGGRLRLASDINHNLNLGVAAQHDELFGTNVVFSVAASLGGIRTTPSPSQIDDAQVDDAIEAPSISEPERNLIGELDPETNFELPRKFGLDATEDPVLEQPEIAADAENTQLQKIQWMLGRLDNPVVRVPTVTVSRQTQTEIFFSEYANDILLNPQQEAPYYFHHVDLALGGAVGDGTAENPFGTVQQALDAARQDGNDIVYVNGEGTSAVIPSFTIPDQVTVLSQGVPQFLAGIPSLQLSLTTQSIRLPFSTDLTAESGYNGILVELPNSGDGVLPIISGGTNHVVRLGNRTVLAGFEIQSTVANGILGQNIDNVELRDNRIAGSGNRGIFLDNVGDSAVLLGNNVSGFAQEGILVDNSMTEQSLEIAIANNTLTDNLTGLALRTNTNGFQDALIHSNQVLNNRNTGIYLEQNSTRAQSVDLELNQIANNQGTGIHIAQNSVGAQEVTVQSNQVTHNALSNGFIDEIAGIYIEHSGAGAQEIFIRSNQIANNGTEQNEAAGIDSWMRGLGTQELTIRNNIIANNAGDGIHSLASSGLQEFPTDTATGDAGISENQILGNGGQAIDVQADGEATIAILSIQNNPDIQGNQANGELGPVISVAATNPDNSICAIISGNRITSTTGPTAIQLINFRDTGNDADPTNDIQAIFSVQDITQNTLTTTDNSLAIQLSSVNGAGTIVVVDPGAYANETNGCVQ